MLYKCKYILSYEGHYRARVCAPALCMHVPITIPHQAARNPLAGARRTVSCPMHTLLLLSPLLLCFSSLLLAAPRAPVATPRRPSPHRHTLAPALSPPPGPYP